MQKAKKTETVDSTTKAVVKSTPKTVAKTVVKKTASVSTGVIKTVKVSRTKLSELLRASSGKFVAVVFVKQDGTERTIVGKASAKDYFTPLGYIKYKDSKNNYKLVDPRTVKELHASNCIYKV